MNGRNNDLVELLLLLKNVIGVVAVIGVFYLLLPIRLIRAATSGIDLSSDQFATAFNDWAVNLADNILLIVLLVFIAILTYGPEVLKLLPGGNEPRY